MTDDSRTGLVERMTGETQIKIAVDLDGRGEVSVDTPIGFLSHMLEALGRHALIDLEVSVAGDLHVDQHHTVEDTGLVLGQAIKQALGDRAGIGRAGCFRHPMDEALADVALDLSGRGVLVYHAEYTDPQVGDLDVALLHDFFDAFSRTLGANLHIDVVRGRSDHHKVEAIFKALARALRQAVAREPRLLGQPLSTKGSFDVEGREGG
jgi:imidazoleglycerol-phosphate dehydratase